MRITGNGHYPRHASVRKHEPLTLSDVCDRCPAPACVRAVLDDLELLFCGHHYAGHEPALLSGGWKVSNDDRAKLHGPALTTFLG